MPINENLLQEAVHAKQIAGNLKNDLVMLQNLASMLDLKARSLEADPTDELLARQVKSTLNKISATWFSMKPDNPEFNNVVTTSPADSGNAIRTPAEAHDSLIKTLENNGMDDVVELLHLATHGRHSPIHLAYDSNGEPRLALPTASGYLIAEFYGDPGCYNGIAVDHIDYDGYGRQCTLVESVAGDDQDKLHVHTWDGTSQDACAHSEIDLTSLDGVYNH